MEQVSKYLSKGLVQLSTDKSLTEYNQPIKDEI